MTRRALLAAGALAAVVLTSCSSPGSTDPEAPPPPDMPDDSTPAPDATEDISQDLEPFYTQTLSWDDCGEQYQCSTLTVPLDYDEPDGDTIDIALLRVPATGTDRQGSLLVNPGGPGASGIDYARNAPVPDAVVSDRVLEHFDIVGFDPRGVGSSTAIDCLDDEELDDFMAHQPTAEDEEGAAELETTMDEFFQGCQARSGALLPHVGTENVARDLDVLRATLGDESLNYLGKSYGTVIGATYAELFPTRVGQMVLDGAVDPTLDSAEVALGQAEGFERAFSAFLDWCLDDDCPLGDSETEARETVDEFLADLEAEPLPTNDPDRPLTSSLAFYGIILPLYLSSDEGYPVLASGFEAAIDDDDGSVLLNLADLYLNRTDEGGYEGNQNEAILAVNCADRPDGVTVSEARATAPEFEDASPIFGQYMAWSGLSCASWPDEAELEPPEVAPAEISGDGAGPILVVGTTGDPATPYEWAEALADQLDSGVLLTYEAFVHTAYLSGSECIDDHVDAYVIEADVPDDGTVCS